MMHQGQAAGYAMKATLMLKKVNDEPLSSQFQGSLASTIVRLINSMWRSAFDVPHCQSLQHSWLISLRGPAGF